MLMVQRKFWVSHCLLGAIAAIGLVVYAVFYLEKTLGLIPCPLCVIQRIVFLGIALLYVFAAIFAFKRCARYTFSSLIIIVSIIGIAIAGRHIWLTLQPPGTIPACGASLEMLLDALPLWEAISTVLAGTGDCAEVSWRWLGLNIPQWSAIAYTGFLFSGLVLLFTGKSFKTH